MNTRLGTLVATALTVYTRWIGPLPRLFLFWNSALSSMRRLYWGCAKIA